MSASMPIPQRKHNRNNTSSSPASASSLSAASDSASSFDPASSALPSYSSSRHIMSSSSSSGSNPQPILSSKAKQKAPVTAAAVASSSPPPDRISARRPSLLGSSLSHSEYTVINLGHSDGPPRLVTCVKSSQGFDWNQELFLPSYADYDSLDLEHRPDPVQEIVLTDEEAAAIFPQW